MEKLRFAIQVVVLTLALPVYFYVELNHPTDKQALTVKETKAVEVKYTKNGKDRTPLEAVTGHLTSNPLTFTASNNSK